MTERASREVETLTIRIPMRLQRRGGRKLIMTPKGAAAPTRKPSRDETLLKPLVRAHRGRRKIKSGQAKSITVEAILDGRQPKGLRLVEMLGNGPVVWEEQQRTFGFRKSE